ncbi:energy-coupling factor transporter transmembrane component T [Clostridiaceae bacterium M8S5]|nr:energy-coupling factor transporter transmembrane component T [Clostridiaceae bacterium M8S5]
MLFRFFPTVRIEWKSINNAMKVRGIGLNIRNIFTKPIKIIEYILVPLLSSMVRIGEELSAAALTRGLGSDVKRTNIAKIGFGIKDVILLMIITTLMIVTIIV